MTTVLRVRRWEDFQHYRDRDPVWIKVYSRLLDDGDFLALPEAAQAQLVKLWLLASRCRNQIRDDARFLRHALHTDKLYTDALIKAGFLERSASNALAESEHGAREMGQMSSPHARPRARGETETETETETTLPPTRANGTGVRETLTAPQRLVIAANQAIEARWGEQTRPLLPGHGATVLLAEDVAQAGVPVEFAESSIVRQIETKTDGPPRSMAYFRPGILEDWQARQVRALGATADPVPALARRNGPVSFLDLP